jgi:hypothetical protein
MAKVMLHSRQRYSRMAAVSARVSTTAARQTGQWIAVGLVVGLNPRGAAGMRGLLSLAAVPRWYSLTAPAMATSRHRLSI